VQAVVKQTSGQEAYQVAINWEEGYLQARNKHGIPIPIAHRQLMAMMKTE